jgi:hypothetical protein
MKNIFFLFLILNFAFLISSCGEGIVDIGAQDYQPKIVVEAYMIPDTKPVDFKICRNYPINSTMDSNSMFLSNASVILTDVSSGKEYTLQYNMRKRTYEYAGNDLITGYNKTYKLSVKATIEGKDLFTSSVTTTPGKGLAIDRANSVLNDMRFRERDENGSLKKNTVVFSPSPGTEFYVIGLKALDAGRSTLIHDNPLMDDSIDVINSQGHVNPYQWILGVNSSEKYLVQEIDWMMTWYLGRYRVIVYAGDNNFKDYLITHDDVSEMDGNLHAPRFHFDGDGIGVFGSVIADTVYFKVIK